MALLKGLGTAASFAKSMDLLRRCGVTQLALSHLTPMMEFCSASPVALQQADQLSNWHQARQFCVAAVVLNMLLLLHLRDLEICVFNETTTCLFCH